jgi:hypothetical protein
MRTGVATEKIRFVDHDARAVLHLERQGRVHRVDLAHRRRAKELLVSVGLRLVRGNPPGLCVVGEGEFRQLVRHLEVVGPVRRPDFIPEGDAVVKGTHHDGEGPMRRCQLRHFYA